jgi:hypothetical protein
MNIFPPGFNASINPYAASMAPTIWPIESSACILMSLQQARRGYALTEDDLGSGMVMSDPTTGIKFVVDAWQQPILFYRWPTPTPYSMDPSDPGNNNNRELDNSDPVGPPSAGSPKTIFRDPLDPEGVLQDPNWNNVTNFISGGPVWWFELYCHSVHEGIAPTSYTARAYYMVPTFVSAGRNNKPGLVQAPIGLGPPPYPAALAPLAGSPYASPLLPDSMVVDRNNPQDSLDNIYSFRLRQGARGD